MSQIKLFYFNIDYPKGVKQTYYYHAYQEGYLHIKGFHLYNATKTDHTLSYKTLEQLIKNE